MGNEPCPPGVSIVTPVLGQESRGLGLEQQDRLTCLLGPSLLGSSLSYGIQKGFPRGQLLRCPPTPSTGWGKFLFRRQVAGGAARFSEAAPVHRAPLLSSWGDRERQGLEQEELQGVAGGLRVARRTGPLRVWLGRVAGFLE